MSAWRAKAKPTDPVLAAFKAAAKTAKKPKKKKMITYRGEQFSGYNKPKRTPKHPNKSHAVLAKEGETIKLIRFGQQGVSGSPSRTGESAADKARRASFKARHASNIAKGKMSAAFWADREKW
jgi:hypothetical protein